MKPEKIVNRKMVEAALIMKQINGEMIQTVPSDVDLRHVYCASHKHSVIDGITPDLYHSDLNRGDGGELSNEPGFAPKFNSISSSASIAVSTFAPWINRLSELSVELGSNKLSGFERLEFEHIAQTAIPNANKHPNLDVWLESDDAILAIECKFCEFLGERTEKASLHKAYKRLAATMDRNNPWVKAIDLVTNTNGECRYRFFDAVQIIRHYFGVLNSGQKEKHLLYLYWHPENEDWEDIHPFDTHMKELKEFSKLVSQATDVHFHYLSFNELWEQWGEMESLEVQKHCRNLKTKYYIQIKEYLTEVNMVPRNKKFRLFTMHGLVQPSIGCEERIRNGLFMAGSLNLFLSNVVTRKIRLAAYEMPLAQKTTSGNRIDLFGYDKDHNPYIIELKTGDARDEIPEVIEQIKRYESMLYKILNNVENAIKEQLLLEEFKLTRDVKRIVLAPASYYTKHDWKPHKDKGVLFCYLRKDKNVDGLAEKVHGEEGVSVYVHNRQGK